MKMDKTSRGFKLGTFNDANGMVCTLQESSAYRQEGLIWLGAKNLEVKVMRGQGWEILNIEELPGVTSVCGNERMHLTQSQVKDLLPTLEYFAEHGVLP